MSSLNEDEYEVVSNMEKYGGGFVKSLANCFHHADYINKVTLINAFPVVWEAYQPSHWEKK